MICVAMLVLSDRADQELIPRERRAEFALNAGLRFLTPEECFEDAPLDEDYVLWGWDPFAYDHSSASEVLLPTPPLTDHELPQLPTRQPCSLLLLRQTLPPTNSSFSSGVLHPARRTTTTLTSSLSVTSASYVSGNLRSNDSS